MTITTEMTGRRKTVTYKDRVLEGLEDLSGGSAHKAVHYNSIRTQVKKNADDAGEILGKLSTPYIKKATGALVDEGILVPLKDQRNKYHFSPRGVTKRRISQVATQEEPKKKRKSLGGTARAVPLEVTSGKGGRRASLPAPKGSKTGIRGRKSEPAIGRSAVSSEPLINRIGPLATDPDRRPTSPLTDLSDDDFQMVDNDFGGAPGQDLSTPPATQVELTSLKAQLAQSAKEVDALKRELNKRAAVEMRYTPHSEDDEPDLSLSNEWNTTNDTTFGDPFQFAPFSSTPPVAVATAPAAAAAGLVRQHSNLSAASHHPTPSPSQSPTEQTSAKLVQELAFVRDELATAHEKVADLAGQLEEATGELDRTRAALENCQAELTISLSEDTTTRAELVTAKETISSLEAALESSNGEHARTSAEFSETQTALLGAKQTIAALERDMAALDQRIAEDAATRAGLESTIKDQATTIATFEKEAEERSVILRDISDMLKETQAELTQLIAIRDTAAEDLAAARAQVEELSGGLAKANDTIRELKSTLVGKDEGIAALHETTVEQTAKIAALEDVVRSDAFKLGEVSDNLVVANAQIEELLAERDAAKAEAGKRTGELAKANEDISILRQAMHDTQGELVHLRGEYEVLRAHKAELETQLEEANRLRVQDAEAASAKVDTIQQMLQDEHDSVAAKALQITQLQATLSERNASIVRLSAQVQNGQQVLETARALLREKHVRTEELKSDLAVMNGSLDEANARVGELETLVKSLENGKAELELSLENVQEELEFAKARFEAVTKELAHEQALGFDLLDQKTDLGSRLSDLDLALRTRTEELTSTTASLAAKAAALADAQSKIVSLEAQTEDLRETLVEADTRYEGLQKRLLDVVRQGGAGEQEYKRKVRMSLGPGPMTAA